MGKELPPTIFSQFVDKIRPLVTELYGTRKTRKWVPYAAMLRICEYTAMRYTREEMSATAQEAVANILCLQDIAMLDPSKHAVEDAIRIARTRLLDGMNNPVEHHRKSSYKKPRITRDTLSGTKELSQDERWRMLELHNQGYTVARIAEDMKRAECTVRLVLKSLGVTSVNRTRPYRKPRQPKWDVDRAVELRRDGLTVAQISERVGASIPTLKERFSRMGIERVKETA